MRLSSRGEYCSSSKTLAPLSSQLPAPLKSLSAQTQAYNALKQNRLVQAVGLLSRGDLDQSSRYNKAIAEGLLDLRMGCLASAGGRFVQAGRAMPFLAEPLFYMVLG
jgi:hypothetical protein